MRLFGIVDGSVDRYDRAQWLTIPFDLAFQQNIPSIFESDDDEDDMLTAITPFKQRPIQTVQIDDISSVTTLTAPTGYEIETISFIMIDAQAQDIRYRLDGVNPTASSGHVLKANKTQMLYCDLTLFKMIEATSGAKCAVTYFTNLGA